MKKEGGFVDKKVYKQHDEGILKVKGEFAEARKRSNTGTLKKTKQKDFRKQGSRSRLSVHARKRIED